MDPLDALQQLGLTLPLPPAPGGNDTSAKTSGNIVYLAGVISQTGDGVLTGTVGWTVRLRRAMPQRVRVRYYSAAEEG
jgi:hypothetical protein